MCRIIVPHAARIWSTSIYALKRPSRLCPPSTWNPHFYTRDSKLAADFLFPPPLRNPRLASLCGTLKRTRSGFLKL